MGQKMGMQTIGCTLKSVVAPEESCELKPSDMTYPSFFFFFNEFSAIHHINTLPANFFSTFTTHEPDKSFQRISHFN